MLVGLADLESIYFAPPEGDGRQDLALAAEWGPVKVFSNGSVGVIDQTTSLGLNTQTARWTSVAAGDLDNDDRMDLVAGKQRIEHLKCTSSSFQGKNLIWKQYG